MIVLIKHTGPSHMGIMFSPAIGVELEKWNLKSEPLVAAEPWNKRKTYFVFYAYAADPVPFNLTLYLKVERFNQNGNEY